jgi:hypothetical protein
MGWKQINGLSPLRVESGHAMNAILPVLLTDRTIGEWRQPLSIRQ